MKIWPCNLRVVPVSELTNLDIGHEKKKKQCISAVVIAPKKTDAAKTQSSKAKNVKGEKKVAKKPKAEPRDTADIPTSNPDDPIDLESSPEALLRTKAAKRNILKLELRGSLLRRFRE
ncbi:hypothetical protein Hanom_Chr09g00855831 [Helianthus anomalus]